MASRRWDEANELLQCSAALGADWAQWVQVLREHEVRLWGELVQLKEDLAHFDAFSAQLVEFHARLAQLTADGDAGE